MREIIGNTTATPNPRPDWAQTDETKADFIKNKPVIGSLASKNEVSKSDLSAEVQEFISAAEYQSFNINFSMSAYSTLHDMLVAIESTGANRKNVNFVRIGGYLNALLAVKFEGDTTTGGAYKIVNIETLEQWSNSGSYFVLLSSIFESNELTTTNQTIKGAINELNEKISQGPDVSALYTLDKLKSIKYHDGEATDSLKCDETGVMWKDYATLYNLNGFYGSELTQAESSYKIPIVAGENVEFTVDEDENVVRVDVSGLNDVIKQTEKGQKNGIATLNSSGVVTASQLPSYIVNGYYYNGQFYSSKQGPSTYLGSISGSGGKIYIDVDTNKIYFWNGTYVEISESLVLGETSTTAYAGDKGRANALAITELQERKANKSDVAPKHIWSTQDIEAGERLQTGTLYIVYQEE